MNSLLKGIEMLIIWILPHKDGGYPSLLLVLMEVNHFLSSKAT